MKTHNPALHWTARGSFAFTALLFLLVPICGNAACNIIDGKAYGDCADVSINYGSKGIINVTVYKSESGIITGANVHAGGTLYFSGISSGDIVVDKSAKLTVTGIVNGTIRNNGGYVEIEGEVDSVVANAGSTTISGIVSYVTGNGKVIYKSGAVIGGKPVESNK